MSALQQRFGFRFIVASAALATGSRTREAYEIIDDGAARCAAVSRSGLEQLGKPPAVRAGG
jgi:hypothetical protein